MAYSPAEAGAQQLRCYEMRLAGHNLDAIAKDVGISVALVRKRLSERVHWAAEEAAENYRQYSFDKLMGYLVPIQDKIRSGDVDAIKTAVRIDESIRKLLGVDAPTMITGSVEHTVKPELVGLLEQIKADNLAERERIAASLGNTSLPFAIEGTVVDAVMVEDDPPTPFAPPVASAPVVASTPRHDVPPDALVTADPLPEPAAPERELTPEALAELLSPEDLDDPRILEMSIEEIQEHVFGAQK